MTTMWSERHAMVRWVPSGAGCIAEALRRRIGEGDARGSSPPLTTAPEGGNEPPSRRAAEPPSRRAAEPPSRRAAEPPSRRAAEPPSRRAAEPPSRRAAEPPSRRAAEPPSRRAAEPPSRRAKSVSGAWRRLLRLTASPPDPSRPGAALRRGLLSPRGALLGARRPGRAAVPALVCFCLLSVAATQAYADTVAVSFEPIEGRTDANARTEWVKEESGTHNLKVKLNPAPTSALTVKYTVSGNAHPGSDFTIVNSGTLSVPAGATTAFIPVTIIDDSKPEAREEIAVWLTLPIEGAGYRIARPYSHHLIIDPSDRPGWVSFASASHTAAEGSGTHDVGVRLNPAPSADITLAYTVGGTATAGSDFTALSGTVTVPKDATTATIPVKLIDDSVPEDSETVVLKLTASAGYRVESPGTHTLTIDASDPPTMSFASAAQSADEGSGTHPVEVRLSTAPTTDITLAYTVGGTAASGSDFTIANSGTVTVPSGATTATIPVKLIDDSVTEGSETVVLKLTASSGYRVGSPGTHTLTIDASDPPTVSVAPGPSPVTEGTDATFTVSVNPAPSADLLVNLTVADAPGADFVDSGDEGGDTVTILAGDASATYTVATVADGATEPSGAVTVTVTGGSDYEVGSPASAFVRVKDDDAITLYRDYIHLSHNSKNVNQMKVSRLAYTLDGVFHVPDAWGFRLCFGGTATHDVDYQVSAHNYVNGLFGWRRVQLTNGCLQANNAADGTQVLAGRDKRAFRLSYPDASSSSGKTIVVTVDRPTNTSLDQGNHTLVFTIPDPSDTPEVSFATTSHSVSEGSQRHIVRIKVSPPPVYGIAVHYTVSGTATDGSDYTIIKSGIVEMKPGLVLGVLSGDTETEFLVRLIDDSVQEGSETFIMTLIEREGYRLGSPGTRTHTLTIVDDETPPSLEPAVTIAAGMSPVTEGGDAAFTLTASPPPASPLAVTVTVAADGDYGIAAGERTVTIPTTGSYTLTLATTGDSADEPDGSVTVTVKDGDGYTVGSSASGTVSVQDDDEPEVTIAAGMSPVTEGGDAAFTLTASPPPASPLAVTVTVAADGDYGITAGTQTVTIPTTGSAMLTLATAGDDADEPDGSVSVTVTDGSGYTVGSSASGTVSIQDDDDPAPACAARQTVVDYLIEVRDNPKNTAVKGNPVHIAKWNRVLEAIGHDTGTGLSPMPASEIHANAAQWPDSPFKTASDHLNCVEAQGGQDQPQQQEPEIAISADAASVTEGGDAAFTLTATPAPAADLPVSVTVASDGDWGVTAGSRTVTIPTSGSATLTLATAGDDADEPDGSVSVTVTDGSGYTVGSSASGTVSIQDDDDPAPACAARQTVVDYLIEVRDDPKNTAVKGNPVHIAKWNRVLEAIGHDTGTGLSPMPASEIHANAAQWPDSPFKTASDHLNCVEAQGGQDQPQQQEPEIAISADAASVTEGGDAVFTLTATPAPAADLAVSVTVATDGDWGVTAGSRTVTIPASGSAKLTLATTDDAADEPDGSVTVAVVDGSGYTVGSPGSGTVSVQDDDAPLPVVTLAAGASVTEGGDAVFTLTASPAPAADLAVSVSVGAQGDWGITAGTQTVTIPTTGSATLTLATTGDDADEPDGSVSVTVTDGSGYTVGASASGTVAVRDDDAPLPEVTLAAGSAVTEGGNAVFTLTASPAPAAGLPVSVSVGTAGDYGIAAGTQAVTIPTTGSATLTLATTDDDADEPDGSVTATVQAGSGYTVGASASGTVAVRDDDLPPPAVTIAAKAASVTEGGDAVFTLTADRAPDADLTVTLAVSEIGDGDHVAAADEGPATVTIPKDATEAVFALATVNDDADEPDGAAVVAVQAGAGYTVGDPAWASVTVEDDDASSGSVLSVGDSTAKEGARLPVMPFTVRLSPPAPGPVRVYVSTRPSTPVSAQPGQDYAPGSYDLTFAVGETEKQVWIRIFDDSHDEEAETFEVVLSDAQGAAIGDGVAVGTITNDDPMPAAWLARFGRTVAEQALDGITGRMAAPRTAGMQGAIAGQAVNFDPAASGQPAAGGVPGSGSGAGAGTALATGEAALAMADIARSFSSDAGGAGHGGIDNGPGSWSGAGGTGFGEMPPQSRTMTARDVLLGSSFSLTGEPDGSGGSMAFWGRAAQGSFDGREGTFSLDGTVTTGMLGADYARGRWLIGLALAQSHGEGDYRDTDVMSRAASQDCPAEAAELCRGAVREGDGTVEASLTAAVPYAAFQASERLKLWGAAGYGTGEVTLKTELGGSYKADTSWSMAAAGLRGDLLEAPAEGSGPALAATSDALWARTSSEKTRDLAASDSDVTRLRVGLEGSYRVALEDGGSLVPKLELGARHDGGDAETGFGVELGGGIEWTDPGMGLILDLSGRTLLAHGDDDLKDRGFSAALAWDPAPATQRGASLSLRQDFGGRAQGGLDALFAPDPLEDRTGGSEATSRWAVEAAWGFAAFGGRFTGSPHVGLGLSTDARDYSLGWRLAPEAGFGTPEVTFGVRATRRESETAQAEHAIGLETRVRW